MSYAIDEVVEYIVGRPDAQTMPAVVVGFGKRRDNGRNYYAIRPILGMNLCRTRCVAGYSIRAASTSTPAPEGRP